MNKRRILIISCVVAVAFLFLIVDAFKKDRNFLENLFTFDIILAIIGSAFASLIVALIMDFSLQQSFMKMEKRIVNLMYAVEELGIHSVARRGEKSSIGRTAVPEEMIKSATGEIIILAYSGKGTIIGQQSLLEKRLKKEKSLHLGCILLNPNSKAVSELKHQKSLSDEINEVIKVLKKLKEMFPDKVQLHLSETLPTFTCTAIDTGILTDIYNNGIIGVQPRIEGENVHHGLIFDVRKKDNGLWGTYKNSLHHYWQGSTFYQLDKNIKTSGN